jgi:hypothetical protein
MAAMMSQSRVRFMDDPTSIIKRPPTLRDSIPGIPIRYAETVEVRNTSPSSPIVSRTSETLIEDLCLALRNVGVMNRNLPNGFRIVESIDEVKAIYAELLKRDVNSDGRIRHLSGETGWQMEVLLADCLAFPGVCPYVREADGIRKQFRCRQCKMAEFPPHSKLEMCDDCMERTVEMLDTVSSALIPPPGLLFYRTYNISKRCLHADSDTVLVTWDHEEFWETGHCKVCLLEERQRRLDAIAQF